MPTSLITYSPGKRTAVVLFTAAMIGIPLANWLVDRADFNHRFLGETLWDISIYFFGLAWLIYAVTLPAIKNWHLVG